MLDVFPRKTQGKCVMHKRSFRLNTVKSKGKGKVLPRTGHEGPEGEQMYILLFL